MRPIAASARGEGENLRHFGNSFAKFAVFAIGSSKLTPIAPQWRWLVIRGDAMTLALRAGCFKAAPQSFGWRRVEPGVSPRKTGRNAQE
jgi:hypothetical protein